MYTETQNDTPVFDNIVIFMLGCGIMAGAGGIAAALNFGLRENCWKILFLLEKISAQNATFWAKNHNFGEI